MKSVINKKIEYDPEKVLNSILEIENLFPVNDWKINGIQIWPLIRTSLAYTQRDLSPKLKIKKNITRYKRFFEYCKMILLMPWHIFLFRKRLKSSKRIFIGAITHRVRMKRMKVNRYFDVAVADFLQQGERSIILDRGTSINKDEYPNKECWFSLPLLYVYGELIKRFKILKKVNYKFELDRYHLFYSYLLIHFHNPDILKIAFDISGIKRKMSNFYERKELIKSFLQASDVQNVYFLCYYSSLFYPFIAACNELNINTTDIQHGGMGSGHFSYDRWSRIPVNGYSLLPRYFWTWDENSCKLVNKWALTTYFHKAICMGTPWVNDLTRFSSYEPPRKDYILYNMTDTILEPYIVKAIRHFGEQKIWILRMHPRQMSGRSILQDQIKQLGFQNFVLIEDSTNVLLIDSLRFCSAFISASSGSVIEAIHVGLTPLLLPSPGFNYYADYVKSGMVVPLMRKNKNELISFLEKMILQKKASVKQGDESSWRSFTSLEKIISGEKASSVVKKI